MEDDGPDRGHDHDVLIVGGGPAGCSAGVFTARYGLGTVVFDRGRSSILRCAHLENYLGFPGGIDVETLYDLMHAQAREAGAEIVSDRVESVGRAEAGVGFVVETQDGRTATARRVVAATRYEGEYLRPLDDGGMFGAEEHDGEDHERFARSYAGFDGTTPIDGLYVASPSAEADRQAIIAAGRGARVGLALVGDVREDRGYPQPVAKRYDWVRRERELDEEWRDRDRWRKRFDGRVPPDHDLDGDRRTELREREIDRVLDTYLSADEITERAVRGQERLLAHLDDDLILERAREITGGRSASEAGD